jgi:integrase
VPSVAVVQPLHVATWIELQQQVSAAPTVKARLAAIRHLFDWLVTGQVVPANPAHSVRGPSHVVKAGKTPVLAPEEARTLIDSIEVTTVAGLRDRALIGLMVFSFARIRAALGMKVEDVFTQSRRLWVQLHGKGGKPHAMPRHRGRHRDQARQPQLPGDWDHGLPQERRDAGEGGADGEPCFDAHDAAKRWDAVPSARCRNGNAHPCMFLSHARVPRVRCTECGVKKVNVPWARAGGCGWKVTWSGDTSERLPNARFAGSMV